MRPTSSRNTARSRNLAKNNRGTLHEVQPLDTSTTASPVLRRRSSILDVLTPSPVLGRKVSSFKRMRRPSVNSVRKTRQSVGSQSPVLGQRKHLLLKGGNLNAKSICKLYSDACDTAQHLFLKEQTRAEAALKSPLRERKNFVNIVATVRGGNKNSTPSKNKDSTPGKIKNSPPTKSKSSAQCKQVFETVGMGKENMQEQQQPLRKSVRTKKVTEKYQKFINRNRCSEINAKSDVTDVGNDESFSILHQSSLVEEQPKGQRGKTKNVLMSVRQKRSAGGGGGVNQSELAVEAPGDDLNALQRKSNRNTRGKRKESRLVNEAPSDESQSSHTDDNENITVVRVDDKENHPVVVGVYNEENCPEKRVLRERKRSNEDGICIESSENITKRRKMTKVPAVFEEQNSNKKRTRKGEGEKSSEIPCKEKTTGRGRAKRKPGASTKSAQTVKENVTAVLEQQSSGELQDSAADAGKKTSEFISLAKDKEGMGISAVGRKRLTREKSTLKIYQLPLSTKQISPSRVSTMKSVQDGESPKGVKGSGNPKEKTKTTVRTKLPIWASAKKSPLRSGKRKSLRLVSDNVFDFPVSPTKGEVAKKRKRQYKPRMKSSKQKSSLKTAILVTDPNFKNPVEAAVESGKTISSMLSRPGGESVRSTATSEYIFDSDLYAEIDTDAVMDGPDDIDVYGRDEGDAFDRFDGGTESSFIPSGSASSAMVSASVNPTPDFSKCRSKFVGSSTPRVETFHFLEELQSQQEPVTVKDDIAQCFGFEGSSDEEEEEEGNFLQDNNSVLSLSPVRHPSHPQSRLNVTIASDMTDSINFSNSQPYRFSWGSLRPGNHSYTSGRSSSLMVHGRTINSSAAMSSMSRVHSRNISSSAMSSVSSLSVISRRKGNSLVGNDGRAKVAGSRKRQGKNPAFALSSANSKKNTKVLAEKDHTNKGQDVSVLFDEEPDGDEQNDNVEKDVPTKSRQTSDIRQFLTQDSVQRSPSKSVNQRVRRSYDRQEKKKFLQQYAGGDSTEVEAETEEDVSVQNDPPKKKKTANRKRVAKQKKTQDAKSADTSQSADETTILKAQNKSKVKKKKNVFEESLKDWASDLNTHFSEIEDCELVLG